MPTIDRALFQEKLSRNHAYVECQTCGVWYFKALYDEDLAEHYSTRQRAFNALHEVYRQIKPGVFVLATDKWSY